MPPIIRFVLTSFLRYLQKSSGGLPKHYFGSRPTLTNCARFVLNCAANYMFCAPSLFEIFAKIFWGPPNHYFGTGLTWMKCARFVLNCDVNYMFCALFLLTISANAFVKALFFLGLFVFGIRNSLNNIIVLIVCSIWHRQLYILCSLPL